METSEVEAFDNREEAYIARVSTHPQGFVANMDRAGDVPQYPMIHRATHGAISSAKIGNFTTGDYMKYCAVDVEALRKYLVAKYRKQPTLCRNCIGTDDPARTAGTVGTAA